MFLTDTEVQQCRALVEKAFPRFAHWTFMNERNDSYAGFSIWGWYKANAGTSSSPRFFVTFDSSSAKWKGHLTVGKHCYYWSSADVGDAHLLNTEACTSLEEAVISLKRRIGGLMAAFSASDDAPATADQGDHAERTAQETEQRLARLAELAAKALRQQATPEELAELQRLLPDAP